MNRSGHQLFSRAGFAHDQDRQIGCSHLIDLEVHVLDGIALAHDFAKRMVQLQL